MSDSSLKFGFGGLGLLSFTSSFLAGTVCSLKRNLLTSKKRWPSDVLSQLHTAGPFSFSCLRSPLTSAFQPPLPRSPGERLRCRRTGSVRKAPPRGRWKGPAGHHLKSQASGSASVVGRKDIQPGAAVLPARHFHVGVGCECRAERLLGQGPEFRPQVTSPDPGPWLGPLTAMRP